MEKKVVPLLHKHLISSQRQIKKQKKSLGDDFMQINSVAVVAAKCNKCCVSRSALAGCVTLIFMLSNPTAKAVEGLRISELPVGSEVVIPGDYAVFANQNQDAVLSGMQYPQAVTLSPVDSKPSIVQVFSKDEKRIRELKLKPGTNTIYNFKTSQPVRFKCLQGSVKFRSLYPVKVQR
jgi:hypothetical protein